MAFLDTLYASYKDGNVSDEDFYDHLHRIALKVTERDDAASEVVIAIAKQIGRGKTFQHFSAWANVIMRRTLDAHLRREYGTEHHTIELIDITTYEDDDPRFLTLLDKMPIIRNEQPRVATAIDRLLEGYTINETATQMQVNPETLRKQLARLKKYF